MSPVERKCVFFLTPDGEALGAEALLHFSLVAGLSDLAVNGKVLRQDRNSEGIRIIERVYHARASPERVLDTVDRPRVLQSQGFMGSLDGAFQRLPETGPPTLLILGAKVIF